MKASTSRSSGAPDSPHELYHFIGKDIPYFHALFWPAMLSGARYRKPSGLFVHGHVTVDGQKISKRRSNFIKAGEFASKVDPDYLRYYYAAKLGPTADDLDLNLTDFVAKVNADLVGKLVNIASRCAGFIHKLNGGRLAATLPEPALYAEFAGAADDLAADFEQREYARAVRKIMALADRANQYIDERKPWILAKQAGAEAEVVAVCTLGLNLFRALIVYLKPIVPALAARAEALLAGGELRWQDVAVPLLGTPIAKFEALLTRVETATVETFGKPAASEHTGRRENHRQWRAHERGNRSRRVPENGAARGARHRGFVRRGRRQAAQAQARRRRRGTHGVLGHPQLL